jgi:hypothetical protein
MTGEEREQLVSRLRSWALGYARHGWAVFPLSPGTNRPALSSKAGGKGCLDATTDLDVVGRMWDRFPLGNIGIATGAASGLYVVDIDPKNDGDVTFSRLVSANGSLLPDGPVVTTPSGGRHYYYRHRPGLANTAGALGVGIDTRGDGGYVAAPPGLRPDGAYEWAVSPRMSLPELPAWLTPTRPEPVRPVRDEQAVAAADADWVLAGLVRTVLDAPQGTRNHKLFWSACRLGEHAAEGRIALDEGAAALLDAAAHIGLSEVEADRTLRSALRQTGVAA